MSLESSLCQKTKMCLCPRGTQQSTEVSSKGSEYQVWDSVRLNVGLHLSNQVDTHRPVSVNKARQAERRKLASGSLSSGAESSSECKRPPGTVCTSPLPPGGLGWEMTEQSPPGRSWGFLQFVEHMAGVPSLPPTPFPVPSAHECLDTLPSEHFRVGAFPCTLPNPAVFFRTCQGPPSTSQDSCRASYLYDLS